jgi:hypothetical protein
MRLKYSAIWVTMMNKIIIEGEIFPSYSAAARYIPCSKNAIALAIKRNKRCIKGKRFWFEGESVPVIDPGRTGLRCIVDGIEYKSVGKAARVVGSRPCALRLALNMKQTFKGHSIAWADEVE